MAHYGSDQGCRVQLGGASPGCSSKGKGKDSSTVTGFFTPIKQKGKFMEHLLSTSHPCTTFSINIFILKGWLGCSWGAGPGAPVVQQWCKLRGVELLAPSKNNEISMI